MKKIITGLLIILGICGISTAQNWDYTTTMYTPIVPATGASWNSFNRSINPSSVRNSPVYDLYGKDHTVGERGVWAAGKPRQLLITGNLFFETVEGRVIATNSGDYIGTAPQLATGARSTTYTDGSLYAYNVGLDNTSTNIVYNPSGNIDIGFFTNVAVDHVWRYKFNAYNTGLGIYTIFGEKYKNGNRQVSFTGLANNYGIGRNAGEISLLGQAYNPNTDSIDTTEKNLFWIRTVGGKEISYDGYYMIYRPGTYLVDSSYSGSRNMVLFHEITGANLEYKIFDECKFESISDLSYCTIYTGGFVTKKDFAKALNGRMFTTMFGEYPCNDGVCSYNNWTGFLLKGSYPFDNYRVFIYPLTGSQQTSTIQQFLSQGVQEEISQNISSGSGQNDLGCNIANLEIQTVTTDFKSSDMTGSTFDFSGSNGNLRLNYNKFNNPIEFTINNRTVSGVNMSMQNLDNLQDFKIVNISTKITSNSISNNVIVPWNGLNIESKDFDIGIKNKEYKLYVTLPATDNKYNVISTPYYLFSKFGSISNICSTLGQYSFYDLLYLYSNIGGTEVYSPVFNLATGTIERGIIPVLGYSTSGNVQTYSYIFFNYYWINKTYFVISATVGKTDDNQLNTSAIQAKDAEINRVNDVVPDITVGSGASIGRIFSCDTNNDGSVSITEGAICPWTIAKNIAIAIGAGFDSIYNSITSIGKIQNGSGQGGFGTGQLPTKLQSWSGIGNSPANSGFAIISGLYSLAFGAFVILLIGIIIYLLLSKKEG